MIYPPMLKSETAHEYATRNNLSQQVVLEALLKNEIPIEGEPLPAQPAQPAKSPAIPTAAPIPTPITTEKPDSAAIATESETTEQRHDEWRRLHREGNSIGDIAAKTDAAYQTVYNFLTKEGLHKPNGRSPATGIAVDNIGDLDDQEARLQAQLAAIQRKKQLLAEAKMLHVERREDGGVIIKKEGNVVVLTYDEANHLADLLTAPVAISANGSGATVKA